MALVPYVPHGSATVAAGSAVGAASYAAYLSRKGREAGELAQEFTQLLQSAKPAGDTCQSVVAAASLGAVLAAVAGFGLGRVTRRQEPEERRGSNRRHVGKSGGRSAESSAVYHRRPGAVASRFTHSDPSS